MWKVFSGMPINVVRVLELVVSLNTDFPPAHDRQKIILIDKKAASQSMRMCQKFASASLTLSH